MPGEFFRSLAAAAKDTYNQAKAEAEARSSMSAAHNGQSTASNHYYPAQYGSQYASRPIDDPYGHQPQGMYDQQYGCNRDTFQQYPGASYGFSPPASPLHQYQNNVAQNHYAQYAGYEAYANVPSPGPYHSGGTPEQTYPSPPAYSAPAAAPQRQANTPQPAKAFSFQPQCAEDCDPLENISQIYYTAAAPDFTVCPKCYNRFVSQTCYVLSFKYEERARGPTANCDLGVHSIRAAWNSACARGMATTSAHEHQVWLDQFARQFRDIQIRIQSVVAELTAGVQDIQVATLQAKYQQQSAMMQIQGGFSSSMWGGGGAISQQMGNQRLIEANQMNVDIQKKRMHLIGLIAQLKQIYGPGLQVNL